MASFWLVDFDENLHAIEAEEDLHVLGSPSLTALPLNNPVLAGLTLLDGRTLIVADLAACLGFPPAPSTPASNLFRFQGEEKGFLVAGRPRLRELGGSPVLPLPEKANGEGLLRGCILVDGAPVPVLDLRRLQTRLSGAAPLPEGERKTFSFVSTQKGNRWRLVQAGGKSFALPASLFPSSPRPRPPVAALARMPKGMVGICVDDGETLSVWSLRSLLKEAESAEEGLLLTSNTDAERLAVVVEQGSEDLVAGDPLPLPPWGGRPGIEEALLLDGKVVPCLGLEELLCQVPNREDNRGGSPRLPVLPQGEWEVTEFEIAGKSHAVSKEETVEILKPLSWCPVPGLSPLIEGVAFWKEAFWPVVNLSCYFGPPLSAADAGCMIALRRGPYRLLLLAERFNGYRLIAPGAQRHLPLQLPHPLVSGCYLAEQKVVLLLDAPALVHYFDPALLRNFRRALGFRKEYQARTILAPGSPERDEVPPAPGREAGEPENQKATPDGGPADEVTGEKPEQERAGLNQISEGGHLAGDPAAKISQSEEKVRVVGGEAEPVSSAEGGHCQAGAAVAEKRRSGRRAEARDGMTPSWHGSAEKRRMPRQGVNQTHGPVPPKPRSGGLDGRTGRLAGAAFLTAISIVAGWLLLHHWVVPKGTFQGVASQTFPSSPAEPAPKGITVQPRAAIPPEEPTRKTGEASPASSYRSSEPIEESAIQPESTDLLSHEPVKKVRVEPQGPVSPPAPEVEEKQPMPAAYKPKPADGSESPPPTGSVNKPYIIRKGDTLWSLSGQFFHNPHAYGELARKNRIADPDVIYPGQILEVEEKLAPSSNSGPAQIPQ